MMNTIKPVHTSADSNINTPPDTTRKIASGRLERDGRQQAGDKFAHPPQGGGLGSVRVIDEPFDQCRHGWRDLGCNVDRIANHRLVLKIQPLPKTERAPIFNIAGPSREKSVTRPLAPAFRS